MVEDELTVVELGSRCNWVWRMLEGLEWWKWCATAEEALLLGCVAEEALALPMILAGGIAMVLEFVSTVRPEATVALVD